MKSGYDLNGHIFLERDTGETLILNYAECIEIFSAISDVTTVPYDRDLICEQLEQSLGLQVGG